MTNANQAQRDKALAEARASLERMQRFDVTTLPRVEDLGAKLNFTEAVEPATNLVDLFRQLHLDALAALPVARLSKIKSHADSAYNRLVSVLNFEPGTGKSDRDNLIQGLYDAYDPTFDGLAEMISYSVRRSTDFERLGREARAIVQALQDRADQIEGDLESNKREAQETLEAIKRVAAEQGVSQQAIYFKTEGDGHNDAAGRWLTATVGTAVALAVYAVATLFIHKIGPLKPLNTYETIQLSVSKVLIFATIFFVLAMCAKNYLAHRHNVVVNKHRQNALATYNSLVKAAIVPTNGDIVLNKAADCIFMPQPTGYSRADAAEGGTTSLLTIGPNSVKPGMASG